MSLPPHPGDWVDRLSRQIEAPGWIDRMSRPTDRPSLRDRLGRRGSQRPSRHRSDPESEPTPRSDAPAPRRARRTYGEPPARLRTRLPPRRTKRLRTGRRVGDRGLDRLPQEDDLRALVAAVGRHDPRMAALVALLPFARRTLPALLRMAPAELEDISMPGWAWTAVLRLLAQRARRGVQHSPLLLCTFRRAEGKPLNRRDVVRMLIRHQHRRGVWPPFTVAAFRHRPWLKRGDRTTSLDGILTAGPRRYLRLLRLGALEGVEKRRLG